MTAALPQTDGGFACLLADPPWAFLTHSGQRCTPHRAAEDHYPTMPLAEMMDMPVADLAARDAALFMWVVDSHLQESLQLAQAWGFHFRTIAFVWVKSRLRDADQIDLFTGDLPEPPISMGYWTRKQAEPCLLFTRGRPRRRSKGVRQLIIEPRREHSRKPDGQYERIEALTDGPRCELFARTDRPGWTSWGRDAGRFGVAA